MHLAHSTRPRLVAALVAVMLPLCVAAAPASAQQSGLVNVAVVNNTIQVPVGVAANVCGVQAAVLAQGVQQGPVNCTALANAQAVAPPRQPGAAGGGRQNGLINIIVANNTVQIPVGVAANVCGVQAAVLAQFVNQAAVACTAQSNAGATA